MLASPKSFAQGASQIGVRLLPKTRGSIFMFRVGDLLKLGSLLGFGYSVRESASRVGV